MAISVNDLAVVKLKNIRFYSTDRKIYCKPEGWAIKHKDLGYLHMANSKKATLVKIPYIPSGGKIIAQTILSGGGFTDYDNVEWLQGEQE